MRRVFFFIGGCVITGLFSCNNEVDGNTAMVKLLASVEQEVHTSRNVFCPEAKLVFYDSLLKASQNDDDRTGAAYNMANALLELGDEKKSVEILEGLLRKVSSRQHDIEEQRTVIKALAMAYIRLGERTNCVHDHTNESCIFPIAGAGVHQDKTGSQKAITLLTNLVEYDPSDHESQWLLNIAFMTIGGYPSQVPATFLIKGLDADSTQRIKPFTDVAMKMGLNVRNMAGGNIVDDFNNDGYPDIIISGWGLKEGMHYYRNNTNGQFVDISDSSGLSKLTGGLNMMQTDYNNDGWKDIFVLRGAWKGAYGNEPNSLLRNNGNGTFTDVTEEAGLLSFHPTQTATWADFNNDGWLDVFIGNESTPSNDKNPCELYINDRTGHFTNIARKAGCDLIDFVKGVTSGDYDRDGWVDIFVSTLTGKKYLLKNQGLANGIGFTDVTQQAGLSINTARTFPTWFWDYDNDGWLDILVCGYEFEKSLAWYSAEEALKLPVGNSGKIFLFRNKHDGSFEDVTVQSSLDKVAFAMGANFGDIDNDGWLDMYLGTGNPLYQSLVPNKMFMNEQGKSFADVTQSSRTGSLQKGHGVAFADLDSDGDLDIYIEMGGAYAGDAYPNSLFLNPGQNDNNWINLVLEGATCNRAAIGAQIKLFFTDGGVERSIYREVNAGGSFGSSPLSQHIGLGRADNIRRMEIKWPGAKEIQVVENISPKQYITIRQGQPKYTTIKRRTADFTSAHAKVILCSPQ